ncbi:hypothetical protein BRADI_2g55213v3 [Brachypodium distachyon]|uniref:Uncharacterized protein n=1 Tax=Brachypodium distachyon TaxID=15368 RepID=A0A0Q3RBY2_BRADI|nr:hypothetical protein BRADI_2g55213v3 [Brachypodium distachyon]
MQYFSCPGINHKEHAGELQHNICRPTLAVQMGAQDAPFLGSRKMPHAVRERGTTGASLWSGTPGWERSKGTRNLESPGYACNTPQLYQPIARNLNISAKANLYTRQLTRPKAQWRINDPKGIPLSDSQCRHFHLARTKVAGAEHELVRVATLILSRPRLAYGGHYSKIKLNFVVTTATPPGREEFREAKKEEAENVKRKQQPLLPPACVRRVGFA